MAHNRAIQIKRPSLQCKPGRFTLVCYEKFERGETSQLRSCFTKHDLIYRESIEIYLL